MSKTQRKHISYKTRCASLLLQLGDIPYSDGKQMTEDQILSLYHLDHNMLHSSLHEDRDKFWNFTHMLIKAHREKTKQDAKIIAKSRRIRAKSPVVDWKVGPTIGAYWISDTGQLYKYEGGKPKPVKKIQSRGFDKRYRKKMSGKVVPR